jgi:hypothetical protein
MKYVFLAIFVLIAAQPVQVSGCDMHQSQEISHGGHSEMPSHDMNDSGGAGIDCCDPDPSVPAGECDSMAHCGACTAGVMGIYSATANLVFSVVCRQYAIDSNAPLNNYSSPPFRPPIA